MTDQNSSVSISHFSKAGNLLQDFLQQYGIESQVQEALLKKIWERIAKEIFSPFLFRHVKFYLYTGNDILLVASSPIIVQEISTYIPMMLEKMQKNLPPTLVVYNIRVKLGNIENH